MQKFISLKGLFVVAIVNHWSEETWKDSNFGCSSSPTPKKIQYAQLTETRRGSYYSSLLQYQFFDY